MEETSDRLPHRWEPHSRIREEMPGPLPNKLADSMHWGTTTPAMENGQKSHETGEIQVRTLAIPRTSLNNKQDRTRPWSKITRVL